MPDDWLESFNKDELPDDLKPTPEEERADELAWAFAVGTQHGKYQSNPEGDPPADDEKLASKMESDTELRSYFDQGVKIGKELPKT